MNKFIVALAGAALVGSLTCAAPAAIYSVHLEGEVAFNGIREAPLSGVNDADTAIMSFDVNSLDFVDHATGSSRGYVIDASSWRLSFADGAVVQGLPSPFPFGRTPYFTMIDDRAMSDGFFVSTDPDSAEGVPIEQSPYNAEFIAEYAADTLASLDIEDAPGRYDLAGLTNVTYSLSSVFGDNVAMQMNFVELRITPAPGGVFLLAPLAFSGRRRRPRGPIRPSPARAQGHPALRVDCAPSPSTRAARRRSLR